MLNIRASNLDEMWEKTNDRLWTMKDKDFDYVRPGVTAHSFHNQLWSETAETHRNLSDFGYSKTKWGMLLKLYFDAPSFALAINRLKMYRSEGARGKKYIVDVPIRFKERGNRSGECLMGMTIRYSIKHGWQAEVFTRASETVSRWGVDLCFIHVLLREVGKHLDFTPSQTQVYWNSASMFQSILTTPLFLILTGREEELLSGKPQSKWQADVQKRFRLAFAAPPEERKYTNYKSQARVVKAYDVIKGRREHRHILKPDELKLPPVNLELPEDFFKMGGFK